MAAIWHNGSQVEPHELPMKLFYAATSPFVRKCLVSAHELGLRERLELVSAAPHPVNRDRMLVASNPLGKIPTLITDEGRCCMTAGRFATISMHWPTISSLRRKGRRGGECWSIRRWQTA